MSQFVIDIQKQFATVEASLGDKAFADKAKAFGEWVNANNAKATSYDEKYALDTYSELLKALNAAKK